LFSPGDADRAVTSFGGDIMRDFVPLIATRTTANYYRLLLTANYY